jgi:hypothetical protein
VFFFCHVSEQAICYQRWILFVFSIFLTAYHHSTATEMEGMKAKDTVLYSASSTRRAQHRSHHTIVDSTYVNWTFYLYFLSMLPWTRKKGASKQASTHHSQLHYDYDFHDIPH